MRLAAGRVGFYPFRGPDGSLYAAPAYFERFSKSKRLPVSLNAAGTTSVKLSATVKEAVADCPYQKTRNLLSQLRIRRKAATVLSLSVP